MTTFYRDRPVTLRRTHTQNEYRGEHEEGNVGRHISSKALVTTCIRGGVEHRQEIAILAILVARPSKEVTAA
jgi:hypothetical protein